MTIIFIYWLICWLFSWKFQKNSAKTQDDTLWCHVFSTKRVVRFTVIDEKIVKSIIKIAIALHKTLKQNEQDMIW